MSIERPVAAPLEAANPEVQIGSMLRCYSLGRGNAAFNYEIREVKLLIGAGSQRPVNGGQGQHGGALDEGALPSLASMWTELADQPVSCINV